MRNKIITIFSLCLTPAVFAATATSPSDFDTSAQTALTAHYEHYKDQEYFSGIALSIYVPDDDIKNYYVGQVARDPNSPKITAKTLFQIGSITKSFTAAVMLQLEKEKKLKLTDTIQDWLPNYTKWSPISITQLLNMTSGLPNYSDTPLWNAEEYKDPAHVWTNEELIKFSYPTENLSPPLKSGYFYSNTGYVLADMIAEKSVSATFQAILLSRTIKKAKLNNTFYPVPTMDSVVKSRLASGYNYNQYDNPFLVGKDLQNNNLSWAAAAGGIVATSEDVVKWVKALFVDDTVLDSTQKAKLMRLVSTQTGKPINKTTRDDPRAFGLGVSQAFDPEIGRFWFYEGETLGFRALYMYIPCNGVIISSIFNSATNSENDHGGELMKNIYKLVLSDDKELSCKA